MSSLRPPPPRALPSERGVIRHQAFGLRRLYVASRLFRVRTPAFDYRALSILTEQPDTTVLPLTGAERAELDRRLDAYKTDPATAVPWPEVRAALGRSPKRLSKAKPAKKPKRGG